MNHYLEHRNNLLSALPVPDLKNKTNTNVTIRSVQTFINDKSVEEKQKPTKYVESDEGKSIDVLRFRLVGQFILIYF